MTSALALLATISEPLTLRLATYLRISKDATGGRLESIDAQRAEVGAYLSRLMPDAIVTEYSDDEAKSLDYRPALEALIAACAAGQYDRVVYVAQDRLTRGAGVFDRLCGALDAGATDWELHSVREGITVSGGDTFPNEVVELVSRRELKKLRERTVKALAHKASLGHPPPGSPFGYARVRLADGSPSLSIDEDQAAGIRRAADLVLSGHSLSEACRMLNKAGLAPKRAASWRTESLKRCLMAPVISGRRAHHGEVVAVGNWPAIIEPERQERIIAILTAPVSTVHTANGPQTINRRRSAPRRYLLTGGLVHCGRCGAPMICAWKAESNASYYVCHTSKGGCNRRAILGAPLEAMVTAAVIERVSSPAFLATLAADDGDGERRAVMVEIDGVRERKSALASRLAAGRMEESDYDRLWDALAAEQGALETRLAELAPAAIGVDLAAVAERWPELTLSQRRGVCAVVLASAVIGDATPGATSFDAGRVSITWRS